MHRVVVLALDGVIPFELSLPSRFLGAALDPEGRPLYEVVTCSLDGRPVRTCADYSIAVEHDASVLAGADTVVIPASEEFVEITDRSALPRRTVEALALIGPGTRIVGICIATYLLAAAGLLDGRPAATHWHHADRFQRLYPEVALAPDVLFVDAGRVLTSAGAAAGIDLMLHVIREDHGSAVATFVARCLVVPPQREGGQAQYVQRPVPVSTEAGTSRTRAWALDRLHEPLGLEELAGHAGMSRRTFTRRFRAETGLSPGQWLIQQRVDLARQLLESSDLPVGRIAQRVGFGTDATLRQHLHAAISTSPGAYRRTFRGTPAVSR
ncbi:transcriptional regulator GlxA family with amidase domain [Kitasatospora sp. MAA4]|uniref:GlxA family transcriptional regulator n=1 Tax=Kitasatospora sp. MAA4 TaxID=3035093 RepID=UPI002473AD58|nr:helix-turn-helix domain-containing protein [Kitasatospora sp. MAA4]MDH6131392.1 transcriptional regulator GlxA family with amidase domain [Kitasatospora sp. MAA4]